MATTLDELKADIQARIDALQAQLDALNFDSGRIVQFATDYVPNAPENLAATREVVETVYAWEQWQVANP